MPLNDWKCQEHGFFEAMEPVCPHGCTDGVMVVFLQAPGTISSKTKRTDKRAKQLAMDFKMSNIKSAKPGENQEGYYTRNNQTEQKREPRPGDAVIWGGGGRFQMGNVLANGAAQSIRGEPVGMQPKSLGNLTGPKVSSMIRDHENLKLPT